MWICPTHKNFEWFIDVLRNVEEKDVNGVLEIHIFVTQFFHKFDLRTTMLVRCVSHLRDAYTALMLRFSTFAKNISAVTAVAACSPI